MKKIRIIDLLLTFLLLSMLVGSFVFVSRVANEDKFQINSSNLNSSSDISISESLSYGGSDDFEEPDYMWNFENIDAIEEISYLENEEIQTLLDSVHPIKSLVYRHYRQPVGDITNYTKFDFNLRVGLEESSFDIFSLYENLVLGIVVSTDDWSVFVHSFNKQDGEIVYKVIGLGDLVDDFDNAKKDFTFQTVAYYQDNYYSSTKIVKTSVVNLVEFYYENGHDVGILYDFYVEKGLID